ncbi:MAG: hypothetical protein E7264_06680 [Lachnospiraceae bacterium]|nr:hypothetical protein [Lachnospiraceae bacterium]
METCLKINIQEINKVKSEFSIEAAELTRLTNKVEDIRKDLALKERNKTVRKNLVSRVEDLNEEITSLKELSTSLADAAKLYKATETKISVEEKFKGQTITNLNKNVKPIETDEEKDWEDKLKENLGMSDQEWEIFKTGLELIIGCIPVVNCIYDVVDLVNTVVEAGEDGEYTNAEKLAIILGVASVAGDLLQVGALAKTVDAGRNATRLAKTSANLAKENAEKTAKTAAKKAAKTGGTQKGTKAAKSAEKWKKDAEKMRNYEKRKEDEYRKAVEAAKKAKKEEVRRQYEKNVKDLVDPAEMAKEGYKETVDNLVEKERQSRKETR